MPIALTSYVSSGERIDSGTNALRGEMKDDLRRATRRAPRVSDARSARSMRKVIGLGVVRAAAGEHIVAVAAQRVDEPASDEAARAGDQRAHGDAL